MNVLHLLICKTQNLKKFVFKPCTLYGRTFENASFCCKTHKGLWPYVEIE